MSEKKTVRKNKGFLHKVRSISIPIITLLLAITITLGVVLYFDLKREKDEKEQNEETVSSLSQKLDSILETAVFPSEK